jgi:hypothetical protein
VKRLSYLAILLALVLGWACLALLKSHLRARHATAARSTEEWYQRTHQIQSLYRSYFRKYGKPPAQLADLAEFAPDYPEAYDAIGTGEWVVLWDAPLSNHPRSAEHIFIAHDAALTNSRGVALTPLSRWPLTADEYAAYQATQAELTAIWTRCAPFLRDLGRLPARLEESHEPRASDEALASGAWVVRWGTALYKEERFNSYLILAYERDPPAPPAWVLLAEGSRIRLDASELDRWLKLYPGGP